MTRLGADATDETIAQLKALGITFVSRYVSDFPWKNLTLPEAQRLSAAGIDIVTNWENDVNDWQGGYPQGVAYATRALAQHAACGGPTGPGEDWGIYFSADMQIDPDDPRLYAYYDGTRSVLGVRHNGAYAQTSVLRKLRSLGLIGCGERGGTWRSMSAFNLPEGLGNPGEFDVEQDGLFNEQYDRDTANSARFGQWRIGGTDMVAWTDKINGPNGRPDGNVVANILTDLGRLRDYLTGDPTAAGPYGPSSPLAQITSTARAVPAIATQLSALGTAVSALEAKVAALSAPAIDPAALAADVKSALADPAVLRAFAHALAVELHNDTPAS